MLQRIKLRLGDGTIVGVDQQALSTWAVDPRAWVQTANNGQWQPLREFLAMERAFRGRAEKTRPSDTARPLPLVYPEPLPPGDRKPLPHTHARLVQEPSPREMEPQLRVIEPPPAAPVEPPSDEPIVVQAFADDPGMANGEPLELPSDEPIVLQSFADDPGMADGEPAELAEPLPAEPIAIQSFADDPALPERESVEPFPMPQDAPIELAPDDGGELAKIAEVSLRSAAPEPIAARLDDEGLSSPPALAEEPGAAAPSFLDTLRTPATADAVEPDAMQALVGEPPETTPEQSWIPGDEIVTLAPALDATEDLAEDPAFFPPAQPVEFPARVEPVAVQSPADEPFGADEPTTAYPQPDDGGMLPLELDPSQEEPALIRLKPVANVPPPGLGVYEERNEDVVKEGRQRSELQERVLNLAARAVSGYEALVTSWIERVRGGRSSSTPLSLSAHDPSLLQPTSAKSFTGGVAHRAGPTRSAPPVLPTPAAATTPGRAATTPVKPPPSIHALPTLRLAAIPREETRRRGDVYQGERGANVAWRWTKRLVGTGALVASVLYAAVNWEDWVPRAEQLGRAAFTKIDRFEQDKQMRQALQDATEQLPHLAPVTIEGILATSPNAALDPPEVLRRASDATDRGLASLTPEEAQELAQLREELLQSLRSSERERLKEYDEARARRPVFPFEDRAAAEVYARAGADLQPERLVRLQALFAKAITAGLATGAEAGPTSAGP